jgi:beta-xylosidase
VYPATEIDPDLFWDDDGQLYITSAGIYQQTMDLETGKVGIPYRIWNGTGLRNPEGPHIFKKDGFYYLIIAEGGTELGHSVTIARSTRVPGPYGSFSKNPILSNRNTSQYFQTVGHADLFQDGSGNWWGIALATRSGAEWKSYPMGREAVLFPVSWETGEWPIFQPVLGKMNGWALPEESRIIPGSGALLEEPGDIDFAPGTAIPTHFVYWRFPKQGAFSVSPEDHPNSLRLNPSRANLTSNAELGPAADQTFIARRQVDTLFSYSVDIYFDPQIQDEEAGVTVFLTRLQHIDLGIVLLPSQPSTTAAATELITNFRFRATDRGHPSASVPATTITPIPKSWLRKPIRLEIRTLNNTHYGFYGALANQPETSRLLGTAPSELVSGGSGPFTGSYSIANFFRWTIC